MSCRQRGVALVYGMIAIVVLLISALALVRGMDTTSGIAGSLGFRRDLVNESDRGIVAARDQFTKGTLSTAASRQTTSTTSNYSAVSLSNDADGVPQALYDDTAFAAVGKPGCSNATSGPVGNDICDTSMGVTIRYLIDRVCLTGTAAPTTAACLSYTPAGDTKGSSRVQRAGAATEWVYRISVRVQGPKNAMAFFQTMIGA